LLHLDGTPDMREVQQCLRHLETIHYRFLRFPGTIPVRGPSHPIASITHCLASAILAQFIPVGRRNIHRPNSNLQYVITTRTNEIAWIPLLWEFQRWHKLFLALSEM
jgi:hypothetical protein